MPPDQVVLTVTASLAIQKSARSHAHNNVEVLFDSMAQSAPSGTRTSVISGRQLLYRIGSIYVDIEVDKTADSDRASLIGQMLDSARPGHAMAGIPVAVLERGKSVARSASNDNGEFHLEFAASRELTLSVRVDGRHCVHLPITNMELHSTTASSGKRRKASAASGTGSTTHQT